MSAPAELLGEFCGVRRKDGVDIWHSEIRFQQRVDGQGTELFAEGCKARAADAAQQQSGLPAKLHQNADGEPDIKRRELPPRNDLRHMPAPSKVWDRASGSAASSSARTLAPISAVLMASTSSAVRTPATLSVTRVERSG